MDGSNRKRSRLDWPGGKNKKMIIFAKAVDVAGLVANTAGHDDHLR